MTKKPGRPPRGTRAANEWIKIRVTPEERRDWEYRASRDELSLSAWIRRRLAR